MANEKHNGWTNYETWCAFTWITDEQEHSAPWYNRAKVLFDAAIPDKLFSQKEKAVSNLAEELKEAVEDKSPLSSGMYADLLGAAISEIDWYELAEAFMEQVEEVPA